MWTGSDIMRRVATLLLAVLLPIASAVADDSADTREYAELFYPNGNLRIQAYL
jgi:hypothetical protein